MVAQIKAETKTFEATRESGETMTVTATFNGKIYNGKRYINCQYRINNTNSGLKQMTAIWQDGRGWVDCPVWKNTLKELFNLQ